MVSYSFKSYESERSIQNSKRPCTEDGERQFMFETIDEVKELKPEEIFQVLASTQGSVLRNFDSEQIQKVIEISLARQYLIILCVRPINEEAFSLTQKLIRKQLKENIKTKIYKIALRLGQKKMQRKNRTDEAQNSSYMADSEDNGELVIQETLREQ